MFNLDDRFWSKVNKTDYCWNWIGASNSKGYGRYKIKGVAYSPHRLVINCFDVNFDVCHKCDNPSCVNPDHLFLGTHKDNMQDMVKKNRCNKPIGDKHHNSKVNPDIVRHIRKKEMQQRAYAKLYGLCQRTVAEIQKKLTWKHVADQPEIGSEGRDQ